MMAAWHKTTLGEICDQVGGIIQTGPFGSQLHESDYSADGIPVVMPKDIIEGRISTESVARVAMEHIYRLARHKLKSGDIVYGRRGDIGRQALIRNGQNGWLCGTGCLRISLGDSVIDPLFLHYYLRQESAISWISGQAVGATMPNLNTGILRSVPVHVPPLPTQRRIAGILSAYDELIENNQRRIRILEEMARSLYREWFVHFRHPGHAPVSLGDIPQGWKLGKLADVCRIIPGYAFRSRDWQSNGVPVVKIKNIQQDNTIDTENTDFVSEAAFQATPSKFVLGHGDILIAMTGATAGKIGKLRVNTPYLLNQRVAKILPEDVFRSLVWCAISTKESQELFFRLADGAAQPNMSGSQIEGVELICPPRSVAEAFARLTDPILKQTDTLYLKSQNLRRTRDLLLPRLLSGQVELATDTPPTTA